MSDLNTYIEANTLRIDASRRGGGIEISAAGFTGIEGAKMTAYQNYLGGGMLGRVMSDRNFKPTTKHQAARVEKLAEALMEYFYNITNDEAGAWDEWAASKSYERQQDRASSAY